MLFPQLSLWLRDRQTRKLMAFKPTLHHPSIDARIASSMYADQQLCAAMAALGINPSAPPAPAPTPPGPVPAPSGFWRFNSNTILTLLIGAVVLAPNMRGCSIPNPFPPSPPPAPAPNPGPSKLMVLVVTPNDVSKVPAAQNAIFSSGIVRDYLSTHCLTGTDGKTPEYRVWNENVQIVGESDLWKTAMGRTRKSLPWIIVNYGAGLFEGPLPATVDDTLTLLKKYGG